MSFHLSSYRTISPLISCRYRIRNLPLIGNNDSSKLLSHIVSADSLSFPSLESEPIYAGGSNTYFPNTTDIAGFTLSLILSNNGVDVITKYFQDWRNLIIPETGIRNYADVYKRDIIFDLVAKDDNDPKLSLKYLGVFPTNVSPLSLSSESSDVIRFEQEFSVDDFKYS